MSVVDQINRWVMKIIRRKRGEVMGPIVCDAGGVRLQNEATVVWTIPWPEIVRVTAFKYPSYVGDTITLIIEAENVDSHALSEDLSGWSEMLAALPEHLTGARKYEEWILELIKAPDDARMTVWERVPG